MDYGKRKFRYSYTNFCKPKLQDPSRRINVGVDNPGKSAMEMLSLKDPALDWVSISKGMGVDAVKVENIEDLVKYFKHGLKEKGPFLIEVLI